MLIFYIFITPLYSDFTLTYRIDNKIIQQTFFKDNEHAIYKFIKDNKLLLKATIINNQKFIEFNENNQSIIYTMPIDSNSSISKSNNIYTILNTKSNPSYEFESNILTIKRDDLNESIIATNKKDILLDINKMQQNLNRLLNKNIDIFTINNRFVILKAKNIELLDYSKKELDNNIFYLDNEAIKNEILNNLSRCSLHICCKENIKAQKAKTINSLLKESKEWKLINSAYCPNTKYEHAIFTNKDDYVVVELLNKPNSGKIDSLKKSGVELKNYNFKIVNGYMIKSAYIPKIDMSIKDIQMPKRTITIYTQGKSSLDKFIKNNLNLEALYNNYSLSN